MPPRPRVRQSPPPADTAGSVALCAFALAYALAMFVRGVPAWVHVLYAATSLGSLALYGADKAAAVAGRGRVPERALHALGVAGGWPGAIVAQRLFRHKTRKRAFRVRFWLTVAANAVLAGALALHRAG